MSKPTDLLEAVPELKWCCGNLCNRPQMIKQITDILDENFRLQTALGELDPNHPLLKEIQNG